MEPENGKNKKKGLKRADTGIQEVVKKDEEMSLIAKKK